MVDDVVILGAARRDDPEPEAVGIRDLGVRPFDVSPGGRTVDAKEVEPERRQAAPRSDARNVEGEVVCGEVVRMGCGGQDRGIAVGARANLDLVRMGEKRKPAELDRPEGDLTGHRKLDVLRRIDGQRPILHPVVAVDVDIRQQSARVRHGGGGDARGGGGRREIFLVDFAARRNPLRDGLRPGRRAIEDDQYRGYPKRHDHRDSKFSSTQQHCSLLVPQAQRAITWHSQRVSCDLGACREAWYTSLVSAPAGDGSGRSGGTAAGDLDDVVARVLRADAPVLVLIRVRFGPGDPDRRSPRRSARRAGRGGERGGEEEVQAASAEQALRTGVDQVTFSRGFSTNGTADQGGSITSSFDCATRKTSCSPSSTSPSRSPRRHGARAMDDACCSKSAVSRPPCAGRVTDFNGACGRSALCTRSGAVTSHVIAATDAQRSLDHTFFRWRLSVRFP